MIWHYISRLWIAIYCCIESQSKNSQVLDHPQHTSDSALLSGMACVDFHFLDYNLFFIFFKQRELKLITLPELVPVLQQGARMQ